MRLVSIHNCSEGMVLAKPIYDNRNLLLLGESKILTKAYKQKLIKTGISHIYIQSDITADISLKDDISLQVRNNATLKIESLLKSVATSNHKSKAVTHGALVKEFKTVFEQLMNELKNTQQLMNLLTHLQVKDEYVFEHSLNVTLYTIAIAKKLHFKEKDLYTIGLGAMLHDVGKLFVPKEILDKPGKLSNEEFREIQRHTEHGFELLRKEIDIPLLAAHCAFQHHEKLDGTGYPRGLKGENIHYYAKVLAVADVFDALTSHRCYRKAMLPHEAMEILMAGTHTHFDPKVLAAFKESIALYPIGITVKLNTGETGIVVNYNNHLPQRPVIRIFKDANNHKLSSYYDLDLATHLTCMIVQCDAILDDSSSLEPVLV